MNGSYSILDSLPLYIINEGIFNIRRVVGNSADSESHFHFSYEVQGAYAEVSK